MSAGAPVDVAVGVVLRSDGRVLLGQRPAGKPYAGWWEFPGGKLERGESVEQALARELHEELGLHIGESCPWVVREFVYPHATVRLHFRRIFDFTGEPHGREGQAFAWRHPDEIGVAPLLPATVPVIAWLRLPPACAFTSAGELGEAAFVAALERRLRERALELLVLSEPALDGQRFEALFYRVFALCREHGCRLLVDDRHPASCARAAGGVLMGARTLAAGEPRAPLPLAAAHAENADDLRRAAALGLDFCIHAGPASLAADVLAQAALPVYLTPAVTGDRSAALRLGAHGVVMGTGFWQD